LPENIEFRTSYPPMTPRKANYELFDKLKSVNISGTFDPVSYQFR
jgi:hypothetical protein